MYRSTKHYANEVSCCFRQHLATESHCQFLHGYALAFTVIFEAERLNEFNWVVDFGGLTAFKERLKHLFDHKTMVAFDDPQLPLIQEMESAGILQITLVEATGCEAFAELVYSEAHSWLFANEYWPRVRVQSVEVREHGANSAIYTG